LEGEGTGELLPTAGSPPGGQQILRNSSSDDHVTPPIRKSYDWGCSAWRKRVAQKWARDLRHAILKQLSAAPLAPESDEFVEEIRQMIAGRYRLLFTIKDRAVHVLHVRGAYVQAVTRIESEDTE
jgi:plasmid stabilization system protein ParE